VPERMRWERLNSHDEEPKGKEMEGGANTFHRHFYVRLVLVVGLSHTPPYTGYTSHNSLPTGFSEFNIPAK
jgi:hypothetical protein